VAVIHLPHPLPMGLHGGWLPDYLGPDPGDPGVPAWAPPERIADYGATNPERDAVGAACDGGVAGGPGQLGPRAGSAAPVQEDPPSLLLLPPFWP
jgi:hypothetical protein